jgi:hypothetical protein
MVEDLITLSPHFRETFNKFVPLERQRKLSFSAFHNLKDEYMNTPEAEAKRLEMRQNPRKKGYFFTNRDFSGRLVPESFHRTEAPRLAAYGSTLYGMKKVLKRKILKSLSEYYNVTLIDFDFSAAHANIATKMQGPGQLHLKECVQSPTFWNDRVTEIFPKVKKTSLPLDKKSCRATLKIMLYTSLNGGNPFSPARVLDNLSNADPFLKEKVSISDVPFERWTRFKSKI